MRIVIHDFAGHGSQYGLAEEFARRRHEVLYVYAADVGGPKAGFLNLERFGGFLTVEPLYLRIKNKYSWAGRLLGQRRYKRDLLRTIGRFGPDYVLSANAPTDVQFAAVRFCRKKGIHFVHWVTDFYSKALEVLLTRRLGPAGHLFALPFQRLDRRIFRMSDAVVYITEDFEQYGRSHKFTCRESSVIRTWAALADLPVRPRNNKWRRAHLLEDRFVFMYCGTLGLKHNPQILERLAMRFAHDSTVAVVVVSEGVGRQYLEGRKVEFKLDNLHLFDFAEHSELPDVLGTADVLVATLESDAGVFCVPSKVLSYCCAGRPILMLAPPENVVCRILREAKAGSSFRPDDGESFLIKAEALRNDPDGRTLLGFNARAYAEKAFDLRLIGDRFLELMNCCEGQKSSTPASAAPGLHYSS